jgi:hemolysin activation/secretion protein
MLLSGSLMGKPLNAQTLDSLADDTDTTSIASFSQDSSDDLLLADSHLNVENPGNILKAVSGDHSALRIAQTPPIPPRNVPPQDVLPPSPPTLPAPTTPTPLPSPPGDLLRPQPLPAPPSEVSPGKIPATITVDRFEVIGSTVFSPEELAKVTAPFTQRPITLTELFQARSAVTKLYVDRGYITSGAYIPPQKLQSGVVTIQVIEGSLTEIKITGTKRLIPRYVRNRLALATHKPLNRDRLLQALQLLQLDPLIKNLSAELSAGVRPGESVLEVEIAEAKTLSIEFTLDNGRSPSVGSFSRRAQLTEANVMGGGDRFTAAYANTDGSDEIDVSYTRFLNPRNGTLSFSFSTTSSEIIEPPFDTLGIQASAFDYQLTLRQPVLQTPTQEVALGLTLSHRDSEATLLNGAIPFPSPGSDLQGRTRISALRFFQEWTKRNSKQVFALRSQLNFGIDFLDSTINDTPPDSQFFSWRGQAQYVRLLAPDTLIIARTDMQLADRALVPQEQFGVGGLGSVRGYRQDFLLTDNGIVASVEGRVPIVRFRQINSVLQVTPFIDFGTGWNDSGALSSNTLAGAGLGLRWQTGNQFTASFAWGIPLISVEDSDRTWQENGLYFSVLFNPF